MSVVPVQVPVSTSVPTLTLAAGSAGGVAVANSIDPVNDYVGIYTASATATQGINRNTYLGLSSAPVGLTDSQTLTNKTLTNPTINAATFSGTLAGTYTIGGTPTFPASVATLTGTQTLTNKILTSPTITSPIITNATLSSDAITGFTVSNSGTIYGISVTTGQISTSSSVLPAALATGIPANKFSNPYKFLVYRNSALNITNSATAVGFDTKAYDTGNNIDVTTNKGRFTAPVAGFYQFSASVLMNTGGAVQTWIALYKNGNGLMYGLWVATGTGNYGSIGSWPPVQLAANDYIEVYAFSSSTEGIDTGSANTYFGGYLVSVT